MLDPTTDILEKESIMSTRLKIVAVLLSLYAAAATAGTATANLAVTATVSSTCTVTTTTVAFGTYNAGAVSPTDASGAVTATCTSGTTYTVALDAGANAGSAGDVTTRRMTDGSSHFLPYQIYLDSSHTTIWGGGLNGSSINPTSSTFSGNGTAQGYTAYGRLTAGNYVTAGSYTDTVVATVTYN
jgi:spore coat protein U-like protein